MANWTLAEGQLADGLPMRLYLGEHEGKLWGASIGDDEHPRNEDEFVWLLRNSRKTGLVSGAPPKELASSPAAWRRAATPFAPLRNGLKWERCQNGAGPDVLQEAVRQVEDYFAGRRHEFTVPLAFNGTPFQVRVWQQLMQIPFGATCSYGDLAAVIGNPSACRAVGSANGRNLLPLFIPCHRVLASGGQLGGFTGGIGLKKRLLAHEAAMLAMPSTSPVA